MRREEELYKERFKKRERLMQWHTPYPEDTSKSRTLIGPVIAGFESFTTSQKEMMVAGRITGLRAHGGASFLDLEDISGKIQLFLSKELLKGIYDVVIENIDLGDFVEARGTAFLTKRGEKTIQATSVAFLAKALRPVPQSWYGLQDIEERFRKRYLDFLLNGDARRSVFFRAKLFEVIRTFLGRNGFLEVETPMLQPIPGGATARPFETKLHALDLPLYLRIAPELYLKRLLVGGFEKVYELGKSFRNEGIDQTHNPEFTSLEFYWAYQNYKGLIRFTEKLFGFLIKSALGGSDTIIFEKHEIRLRPPWKKIEYDDLLETLGLSFESSSNDIREVLRRHGTKITELNTASTQELLDTAIKKIALPMLVQPTVLLHHPTALSPLAKARPGNSRKAARFQLIIAGMEIINAYSELNDPVEQRKRFEEQEKARRKGSKEAQRYDADFVEALEYGMPPAAGFGMGMDRLAMIVSGARSLREVILFPTMKPKNVKSKK